MDTIKLRKTLLAISTILVFVLSCYICIVKIKDYNTKKDMYQVNTNGYDSINTNSDVGHIVSGKGSLIFKIEYDKSGDIEIEKEESAKKLAGSTKNEVEDIYKKSGYEIDSFSPLKIVLVKKVDKYAPNKYVVGIKDGFIAIYKTDKDGNMFIEDSTRDITDIKTSRLKDKDIELLTEGDKYFQCDTREDAESRLEDYE
ncbi:hypothetical protein ACSVC9_11030 [Clostridium sp. LBM24168]